MSRSSSSCGTARQSSGFVYFTNSVSVTLLTFTSVVCAESITEISSSSGLRNRSAIAASACSTASRSMTGRMRCFFGPTHFRASRTKLRGTQLEGADRLAQAHAAAHEIERRARGARKVARRRTELSRMDPRDAHRELRLERADLRHAERRRDDGIGPLQEVVDDLDRLRSRTEAGERIHEALEPVIGLHDLLRRRIPDEVGLVVEDERAGPAVVEDVE